VIFTLLTPAFHDDPSTELSANVNDAVMQSSIEARTDVKNRFMAEDP
jgi:hypothetical protein